MFFKSLLPILLCMFVITSCYKTKPTELEITVKDVGGNPISNASVHVFGEPSNYNDEAPIEANYEELTNSNGVALFAFNEIYQPGQNGVAILKVEVNKNEKIGISTIELFQESTNRLEIIIE